MRNEIKYYRKKANLTQEQLAQGILSVSHLSKIENGQIKPKPDVLDLLFERLDIDTQQRKNEQIESLCKEWFRKISLGQKKEAKDLYKRIYNNQTLRGGHLEKLVEIHSIHFYILVNNMPAASKAVSDTRGLVEFYNSTEKYYWHKFMGNYHFSQQDYSRSYRYYIKAKELLSESNSFFFEDEQHDLFYLIAITSSKLRKVYQITKYAEKSLYYYQQIYNLKRCAECHVLLGLGFQYVTEYKKAIQHYQKAQTIAEGLDNNQLVSLCKQNIGHLYSFQGKSALAVKSYLSCYDLRKNNGEENILITIVSLAEEYNKMNNQKETLTGLQHGIDYANKHKCSDQLLSYRLQLLNHLVTGDDNAFEGLLALEILPYLEEKQLAYEKAFFSNVLGEFYLHKRKYKKAATYLQQSAKQFFNLLN